MQSNAKIYAKDGGVKNDIEMEDERSPAEQARELFTGTAYFWPVYILSAALCLAEPVICAFPASPMPMFSPTTALSRPTPTPSRTPFALSPTFAPSPSPPFASQNYDRAFVDVQLFVLLGSSLAFLVDMYFVASNMTDEMFDDDVSFFQKMIASIDGSALYALFWLTFGWITIWPILYENSAIPAGISVMRCFRVLHLVEYIRILKRAEDRKSKDDKKGMNIFKKYLISMPWKLVSNSCCLVADFSKNMFNELFTPNSLGKISFLVALLTINGGVFFWSFTCRFCCDFDTVFLLNLRILGCVSQQIRSFVDRGGQFV